MQPSSASFGAGKPTPNLRLLTPTVNGKMASGEGKSWAQAWQGGEILSLTFDLGGKEEITDPYTESWVVNRCINLISTNVASVPLKVWASDSDEAAEVADTEAIVLPLRKPNGWMTWAQLMTLTTIHRYTDGECFWFLFATNDYTKGPVVGANPPGMIWPVAGSSVSEMKDKAEQIIGWKFKAGSATFDFPREAVLQFRAPNPKNPLRGLSPLKPLERILQMGWTADRYQEGLLRNGGDPGGFIHVPQALQPADRQRLEAEASDRFDNPATAGRTHVLDAGATYQANPGTTKDVQYLEGHEAWNDAVCSVLGVDPICIGRGKDASSYNNQKTAFQQLWRVTIVPLLHEYEDVFNTRYFEPRGKYVAGFDLSEIEELKEDISEKLKLASDIVVSGPGLSFNEVTGMLSIEVEPPENGDTHFMASTTKPLDGALGEQARVDEEARRQAEMDALARQDAASGQGGAQEGGGKSLRAENKAVRDRRAYWKAFSERVLHPSSKQIELASRLFLSRYAKAQRARLADFAEHGQAAKGFAKDFNPAPLDALLLDPAEWAAKFEKIVGPALAKAWSISLKEAADDVGAEMMDPRDERILRAIKTQLVKLTEGVNGTLAEKVRDALGEALNQPATIGELQEAVRSTLPALEESLAKVFGTNDARALAIARTESSHAANSARIEQYKEADIEELEWIHAGAVTEDSREDHVALDGQRVRLGEKFSNGLMYPHDPLAPASEVVNCDCISAAVIE